MAHVPAPSAPRWALVGPDGPAAGSPALLARPVLFAVLRRGLPHLVEATLIPTALFLGMGALWGPGAAMVAVLVWSFVAVGRRLARRQRIPALLGLASVGLLVRTVVGIASGSTFAYFVQPVATTVALAAVFAGSVLFGRPVIARLAHDFVPLGPEICDRPAVAHLFAGLTLLWAGVHMVNAATTFGLLVALPVPMFVALKSVASAAITVPAIALTVALALRTARSERLVFQET